MLIRISMLKYFETTVWVSRFIEYLVPLKEMLMAKTAHVLFLMTK